MNREEIRKKWKNKEFVEITNSKPNLSSNERNYVKPISNDMWSNVMNRANQILNTTKKNSEVGGIVNVKNVKSMNFFENRKKDISAIGNNFALGIKDSGIQTAYAIDRQTYRNSSGYRDLSKRQQAQQKKEEENENIKSGIEGNKGILPTAENLRKTEIQKVGLLPMRDTKETTAFQRGASKILEQDEEKIQNNIDSTTNKFTKKIAELTPSIAQSATGMAISAMNPILRNRIFHGKCYRRIYS